MVTIARPSKNEYKDIMVTIARPSKNEYNDSWSRLQDLQRTNKRTHGHDCKTFKERIHGDDSKTFKERIKGLMVTIARPSKNEYNDSWSQRPSMNE